MRITKGAALNRGSGKITAHRPRSGKREKVKARIKIPVQRQSQGQGQGHGWDHSIGWYQGAGAQDRVQVGIEVRVNVRVRVWVGQLTTCVEGAAAASAVSASLAAPGSTGEATAEACTDVRAGALAEAAPLLDLLPAGFAALPEAPFRRFAGRS